jgi:very-short-patch-repair endonuclease
VKDYRLSPDCVLAYFCEQAGLVVEIERSAHPIRRKEDAWHDECLKAAGLRVLRIPEEVILRRPQSARNTILEELPVLETTE